MLLPTKACSSMPKRMAMPGIRVGNGTVGIHARALPCSSVTMPWIRRCVVGERGKSYRLSIFWKSPRPACVRLA